MAKEAEKDERKMISRMARYLGCTGSHRGPDGQLMPCSTHEELMRISNRAEPKKKAYVEEEEKPKRKRKGKRRRDGWEELGSDGPAGIDTLPGGGLVSAAIGAKQQFIYGRARPRLGDPDVFTNPHSARLRARQLGCVGIARRSTPDGDVVWTPCTNNSDYRRRMGIGPQAARDRRRAEQALIRRVRRQAKIKSGEMDQMSLSRKVGSDFDGSVKSVPRDAEWRDTIKYLTVPANDFESKAKKRRKARRDRLAATPALPEERRSGSSRNAEGTARSASSGSKIEIDAATTAALKNKVKEHNEKMKKQNKPAHTRASLGALKSVYRRGAGAFSSSHRPGMTRGRWAYARVNAFLHLLSTGKPKNERYTTDNDLLPSGHPRKSGKKSLAVKVLPLEF